MTCIYTHRVLRQARLSVITVMEAGLVSADMGQAKAAATITAGQTEWVVRGIHVLHKYAEPVICDITITNGGRLGPGAGPVLPGASIGAAAAWPICALT